MQGLRVLMLGRGRIEFDGQALTRLLAPKQQALLFVLASSEGPLTRGRLAGLLWSDLDDAAARSNLRVALSRMKRWLPGVVTTGREIGFASDLLLEVDVRALADAHGERTTRAQREAAAALWRGPFLEDFEIGASEAFESWLRTMRQRTLQQILGLRGRLLHEADSTQDEEAALRHARALLDVDDAHEAGHMALMRLLAARGERRAAIAQYEACKAALAERLGARPSQACYALYARIHADESDESHQPSALGLTHSAVPDSPLTECEAPADATAADKPRTSKVWRAPESTQHLDPARVIGRDEEVAQICDRLAQPACRWLTLIGPAGVGKTSLARAIAGKLGPHHRHGVMWLNGRDDAGGALRDPERLTEHITARIGVDRLVPNALLLVLDNLEQLRDSPSFAQGLAQRVPGISVLATSRRRMGHGREWIYELGGLSVTRQHPEDPLSSPAAQLFMAAASRFLRDVDLRRQGNAIEQLCIRLGGLPLALTISARSAFTAGIGPLLESLDAGQFPDAIECHSTEVALSAPAEVEVKEEPNNSLAVEQPLGNLTRVLLDSFAQLDSSICRLAIRLAHLPAAFDTKLAAAVGASIETVDGLRTQCNSPTTTILA